MKYFFDCNLSVPRPPKRKPKQQKKPSALKREHPALQNKKFKFLFFSLIFLSFLPSWIRIWNITIVLTSYSVPLYYLK